MASASRFPPSGRGAGSSSWGRQASRRESSRAKDSIRRGRLTVAASSTRRNRSSTPYGRNSKASLWIVDVAGGNKKRLYEGDAVQPAWSPSGRRIAFWEVGQGRRDIKTMAAEGGAATAVTNDVSTEWGPFWAPDGRSLFFMSDRGGSPDLWRVAIDEATGETRGAPEPVTSGVAPVMAGSISADGKRIAVQITQSQGEILRLGFDPATVRVRGEPVSIFASANPLFQLDLSADARWITYRTSSPTENIFVMRADGGERRRLTDDAFRNRGPVWIRGEWLLFYSNRSGSYEMWLMRRDGTRSPEGDESSGSRARFAVGLSGWLPRCVLLGLRGDTQARHGPSPGRLVCKGWGAGADRHRDRRRRVPSHGLVSGWEAHGGICSHAGGCGCSDLFESRPGASRSTSVCTVDRTFGSRGCPTAVAFSIGTDCATRPSSTTLTYKKARTSPASRGRASRRSQPMDVRSW